jgi:hypothetical protein
MPLNAAHTAGQLQAARMPRRRLEQPFKASAQIGRSAYIRLGVSFRAIERKNRGVLRQLRQRGPGVSRIEADVLHYNLGILLRS